MQHSKISNQNSLRDLSREPCVVNIASLELEFQVVISSGRSKVT